MPVLLRKPWPWLLLLAVVIAAVQVRGRLQGPVVEVYRVSAGPLLANVVATGRVQTPSRVTAASEIIGTLVERPVREGDRVQTGDLLGRLDDREVRSRMMEAEAALAQLAGRQRPEAEAALRAASTRLAQARREAGRQSELVQRGLVSAERAEQAAQALALAEADHARAAAVAAAVASGGVDEILLRERLATARMQLARTEIRSQVDGVVLRRLAEPGDVVQPGRGIVELAVDGPTEIVAAVDERNLDRLALDQPALVSADAFPDERLQGTLVFIAPAIDLQTGTIEVRVRVDEPAPHLRQDMTVSIDIEVGRRERALVLPADALRDRKGDGASVLRLQDGRVQRSAVKLGVRGTGAVEVLQGLSDGDLVLPGNAKLAEGARARPAPAR